MLYHSPFNIYIWVKILLQIFNDFPVSSGRPVFVIRVEFPFEATAAVCIGKI